MRRKPARVHPENIRHCRVVCRRSAVSICREKSVFPNIVCDAVRLAGAFFQDAAGDAVQPESSPFLAQITVGRAVSDGVEPHKNFGEDLPPGSLSRRVPVVDPDAPAPFHAFEERTENIVGNRRVGGFGRIVIRAGDEQRIWQFVRRKVRFFLHVLWFFRRRTPRRRRDFSGRKSLFAEAVRSPFSGFGSRTS